MTSGIPLAKLRSELGEVVSRVSHGGERVRITRNGKVAAVLISPEDADLLERLEDEQDLIEAEKRLADPAQKPRPYRPHP
jgi:prevent-host-death family protein